MRLRMEHENELARLRLRHQDELARLRVLEAMLMCPICHELPAAPVAVVGCGHIFCSLCVRRYLCEQLSRSRCPDPVCRQPATASALQPLRSLDYEVHRSSVTAPGALVSAPLQSANSAPSTESPRYYAQLIDASEVVLRASLKRAGLPDTGTREELTARHHEFVLRHNAAIDGAKSPSGKDVVVAVRAWERGMLNERTRAANAAKRKAAGSMFFATVESASKRTRVSADNERSWDDRAMTATLGEGNADSKAVPAVGDSFAELIRKASLRKKYGGAAKGMTAADNDLTKSTAAGAAATSALRTSPSQSTPPPPSRKVSDRSVVFDVIDLDDDDDDVPTPPDSPINKQLPPVDEKIAQLGNTVVSTPHAVEIVDVVDNTPLSPNIGRGVDLADVQQQQGDDIFAKDAAHSDAVLNKDYMVVDGDNSAYELARAQSAELQPTPELPLRPFQSVCATRQPLVSSDINILKGPSGALQTYNEAANVAPNGPHDLRSPAVVCDADLTRRGSASVDYAALRAGSPALECTPSPFPPKMLHFEGTSQSSSADLNTSTLKEQQERMEKNRLIAQARLRANRLAREQQQQQQQPQPQQLPHKQQQEQEQQRHQRQQPPQPH
jgi:Zinc finger, C3HC4 type (RING finger)